MEVVAPVAAAGHDAVLRSMVMSMGTVKRLVILGWKDHLFSTQLLHPDPLPLLAADHTFSVFFVLHLLSVLLFVVVVLLHLLLLLLLRSPNPSLLLT